MEPPSSCLVVDDGIGFSSQSAEHFSGHGLRNMRARAERLGGRLDVSAGPEGGTVLKWQAQLPSH